MTDILFLTHNRLEFTKACFNSLLVHTDWSKVDRFVWYDDASIDSTQFLFSALHPSIPVPAVYRPGHYGNPVAVMRHYLNNNPADIFVKIDNDVMLCDYWLTECLNVMDAHPELGILGIEVFDPILPGQVRRTYRKVRHVGGIGLMRTSAFALSSPEPKHIHSGFTEWQIVNSQVTKGWLVPALPILLLDLMPNEPWYSLSQKYEAIGWQRYWPKYDNRHNLWQWIDEGAPVHAK